MAEKEGLHQRLKQAIVWLKQNKNMLQLDIAEKMSMTTVGLSRGIARCKEKNDEDFVIKFHQATGEIFSLDWLLHGTGEKFTADCKRQNNLPPATDQTYLMSKMFETLLKPIESAHAQAVAALNEQIAEKQFRIDDLEQTIAAKDEIIRARDSRILELERRIAQLNADDLSKYPYTIGVSEERTNPQNINILK